MATRRTSEEREKIFKEWSGQEKPWLDYLDMRVADLLVKSEDGHIYLKNDLDDEENKFHYQWDRRNHDPAYCRMINVTTEREQRKKEKWYFRLIIEFGPFVIPVIIIMISRNELSHTDLLVLLAVYFLIKCEMILVEHLRHKEEDQILREWDLHQKVNRISEILDDMVREQSRAGAQ